MARFRAALGLRPEDLDPAFPKGFTPTPLSLTPEQLWEVALTRNPRLRQMEAEIRMAESGIRLAHLSRLPDFSAGIEADVKASPIMWRPSLGVTLPIWRDKIAAELAAAQAREQAVRERLSAEQIELAVEFADRSYMYREASRNLEWIFQQMLPKSLHAVEVARSAYASAVAGFLDLLEAQRTLLEIRLAEIDASSQRESALAELSLLIAGLPPAGTSTIDVTSTHSPVPPKTP
jgi:outer membrane protein TolC